jgi:hypothetical protein
MEVTTISGQTVIRKHYENQESLRLNISDLPEGAYLITIQSNHKCARFKLIKK